MIVAKVVRTLGIFKRVQNSCRTIAGTAYDGKKSAGILKLMDWPPQSSDLNPIKQIWGESENKLDRSILH